MQQLSLQIHFYHRELPITTGSINSQPTDSLLAKMGKEGRTHTVSESINWLHFQRAICKYPLNF